MIHNTSGALVGGASPDNHLGDHGEGVDYEVPENIKTLHHLALQYVNQVRQSGRLYLLRSGTRCISAVHIDIV